MPEIDESAVYDAVKGSPDSVAELLDVLVVLLQSQNTVKCINYADPQSGATPLHLATEHLKTEAVALLLEHGANPNAKDLKGYTSVLNAMAHLQDVCQCEICKRKAAKIIQLLGEHGADMNVTVTINETGNERKLTVSALYMAARLGIAPCATALLNHGASLTTPTAGPTSPSSGKVRPLMAVLLERVPQVILTVFDRAIQPGPTPDPCLGPPKVRSDKSYELVFDMSAIMPPQSSYKTPPTSGAANRGTGMDAGKSSAKSQNSSRPRQRPSSEMGFISQLLDSSLRQDVQTYNAVLQHPLVHVFADIKWNRLKWLYFGYMLMHANFLVWYSAFLFLVIYVDCDLRRVAGERLTNMTTTHTLINIPGAEGILQISDPFSCQIHLSTKVVAVYVLFLALTACMKEALQIVMDFRNYVQDIVNYVQVFGLGTSLATVGIVLAASPNAPTHSHVRLLQVWLYPLASFGVGVSWLQLFLIVGRLPEFSMYLEMLSRITINFILSLAMYSFILIAFAMSYCMLFPMDSSLADFPLALLRIMSSMIGELNFETLFGDTTRIINPWMAMIWYACLMVGVAMVLMNLLVGLAVSDIQGCKRNAEVVVIQRRLRYLVYLEKSFYLGTLLAPGCLRDFLRRRVAVVTPEGVEGTLNVTVRPNDPWAGHWLTPATRTAIKSWLRRTGTQREGHKEGSLGHTWTHDGSPSRGRRGKRPKAPREGDALAGWKPPSSEGAPSESEPRRSLLHVEYKVQQLESRLIELDAKFDRYFQQILYISENKEVEL